MMIASVDVDSVGLSRGIAKGSHTVSGRALLYCGTPPVSAKNTLALLENPMHAIWFPPGARRTKPSPGDEVWVVWRQAPGAAAMLLGAGRLRASAGGELLWTNRSAPGIR